MALINCPECNHCVSDTAESCPNCGYRLQQQPSNNAVPVSKNEQSFQKVVNPLSSSTLNVVLAFVGASTLIAVGIPLIAAGIGVILIILGVIGFFYLLADNQKYKFGKCPYCGTRLKLKTVSEGLFKCPSCNNIGKQTENTLESTH